MHPMVRVREKSAEVMAPGNCEDRRMQKEAEKALVLGVGDRDRVCQTWSRGSKAF